MKNSDYTGWKEAGDATDENRTRLGGLDAEFVRRCFVTGWLVCTEGPEKGRDYRLRYGFNRIGRDHQMDVCIFEDEGISRDAHCCIVYEDKKNRFQLVPGQGTLTWLEGRLLEKPQELFGGERFTIGSTTLEFVAFCRNGVTWENI